MKIVSLLPAASEIICDMGLSNYLYGVSHECNYPQVIKKIKKVTSSIIPKSLDQNSIDKLVKKAVTKNIPLYEVDNQEILKINPDLIITQGLCDVCSISEDKIQATLKNNLCTLTSKTQIISLNGTTFEEICSDIMMIGRAVNKEEAAKKIIVEAVRKKNQITKEKINKTILLLEWIDPYFTPGHWIPEQIEMAGLLSSIGIKGEKSKEITPKEIIDLNPDFIGLICCGYNLEENKIFAEKLYIDDRINQLEAIKKERIFAFDSNSYFSRPSLRILEGAIQLNSAISNKDTKFHCKKIKLRK
ncbi:ABC transporter substrate-binding protein [Alphaproteobacteria bacterium]|nr:ABC transporter substrate-binding protein [Alphaproteobacteria bacterium]